MERDKIIIATHRERDVYIWRYNKYINKDRYRYIEMHIDIDIETSIAFTLYRLTIAQ